ASFRQKLAKGDSTGAAKKTQKRKGQAVSQVHSSGWMASKDLYFKSIDPDGFLQLQQLQQAVEKRNEIIVKLSSNLQEALASRDQVQLEAQSLAGQIQALQKQLQQTSVDFLRIKSQSGVDILNTHQHQPGDSSKLSDINHKKALSDESGNLGPSSQSSVESTDSDTDIIVHKLKAQLEEERENSKRIYADLAEEIEKHQHVLSLLEMERKGREEEREMREVQLQELQTQCLEMHQFKAEKEKLNREVLELKKRLQEKEDAEGTFSKEVLASSALRVQILEDEMKSLKEEHKIEVERVRQLLAEREKELKFREEEMMGLKASKNRQNQAKAVLSCDESMNVSLPGDVLMERYLCSAPVAQSQSSMVNECFEHCSPLDSTADNSFELNSEVLGDEPLSISNRFPEENDTQNPHWSPGIPVADNSNPHSVLQRPHNSSLCDLEMNRLSGQQFEETDLEKGLLNQQCEELREELAVKDRELNVLREEVFNSAEELEEARSSLYLNFKEMRTKHKTTAALLDQRSKELDDTLKELETTRAQILNELEKSQRNLDSAETEKNELQSQIVCLKQNLANLEEVQTQVLQEREEHKRKENEMDERIKKMEQVLEEELEQFQDLLKAKEVELTEVKEKWEEERQEKDKALLDVRHRLEEQRWEREEEVKIFELQVFSASHVSDSVFPQVTEREHERMVSELTVKHTEEITRLRESMEAAHQAELQQAQTIEIESLRLSLTSVHTSQLEHSQVNLQQEHESNLTNVQVSLRDTFAKESAILQAQHQLELKQIRKQNQEQQERLHELQQWETSVAQEKAAMKEKQAKEIQKELASTQASLTQTNKALTEAQAALSQTQTELQESWAKLEELQTSSKVQSQKLEEELKQAWADRDSAARSLEELISSHKAVLQEREQQALHLEEKERQLQQEVLHLQEEKKLLKQSSEQEVGQLWTQLESMRANRQELGELKEQLLARSSRVEDIERLKTEFNDQKRDIKEQNEAELESLRRYFEQRLRVTEENYREEIALLQLKLVEGALEESVLKTTDDRYVSEKDNTFSDTNLTLEKPKETLDSVCLQLEEKHTMELVNLQSSMTLSFKEELQQVRSDLTDHYYEELQQMKTCHALELEQLRAKLSDRHLQGTCNILKDYEMQMNTQKKLQTMLGEELQEKHKTALSALKSELDKERTSLTKALHEEREKFKSLQAALENDESPQVLKVKQRLEAHYDNELNKAKTCMAAEIQALTALLQGQGQEELCLAKERFHEEKAVLVQSLAQKYEMCLAELNNKHQTEVEHERATLLSKHSKEMDTLHTKHKAQLDSLSASHRGELELVALETTLNSKRKADLDSLEAVFQETNQAQVESLEAELARKHQEERDELEKRMLSNMDTLEVTYLKEVQLNLQKLEHKQLMESHASEQLSLREELRKELAQVHIEKFSAMAAELSHVHKVRKRAVGHLKLSVNQSVLELEQQHSAALQDLSQTYNTEKEQLIEQQQLQSVSELRGVSARELEACRRELEEESSRQRQHFLEEVELLKVQSEERLQDRLNQLKFEEQKQVELEDLRRVFISEQEEKERNYTGKMSQLTAQLQQLDLRSEVGCLQAELKGKSAEMETLDTLLQRRERESQEGGNLLKMLTDDLQTAKQEKHKLDQANEKLRKVLIEMIRSTIATEELIGQKITPRAEKTPRGSFGSVAFVGISVADFSTDDPELTHMLCESLLISDNHITPDGEDAAQNVCSRLHQTINTVLELLNHANTQLEQTHDVHLSLEEKFSKGREESASLLEQHKLLLEKLDQEAKLKSHLQLELHKTEGLLEGYVAEKAVLEESLQQKEAQEERLVEELEDLKGKLKHQELGEEHTVLLRLKEHLSAGLGEREKASFLFQALLAETEHLAQERLDLQRQAEKDHSSLSMRLRALERELEEQETKGLETEQHHKFHTEDLHQRVQALEKQLKHDRQFIEEQAVEREHERDEFQQEIRRLEAKLKHTASVDNKGHRVRPIRYQVESLQAIIKDKTDDHASLLAANQQAQRDVAERNDEIDKLAGRIRELEQALLNSAESHRSVSQLEQELHRVKLREQELTQDKQALEQQQLSNRLQISALQSKLDETRHCYQDNTHDPTQELREALDTAQQCLHSKEREVCNINAELVYIKDLKGVVIKEVELKHLTLQLELLTKQNAAHVNELQEKVAALKENVSALTILKEEREEKSSPDEETLPSALLQEKNQEIDHLNNEIQRLEQELQNTRDNKVMEAELEELHSQVEHLQSEIMRVREDKQDEEERLHEVISTLQAELATLGPNRHEVSDSQDGDSINPSPAPSPEPHQCPIQEQDRSRGPNSLKQELSLTHSASSRSLQSRLRVLQSQLETAVAEKEGLERLLLTQEEEYRGHGEEFGKRLKAEREKADELKSLLTLKETELEQVKEQIEEETEKRKLSEKERDSFKIQTEEVNALHEKNAHLNSQIVELQKKEQESLNMEELVTVRGELFAEREALRRREGQLQEEIEMLRQEVMSMRVRIQDLTVQLNEKKTSREEAQKEVLTHAELNLAKADASLRQKEGELARLRAEHQALTLELTTVKQGLTTSTERAEKLHGEGQNKDRALVNLENDNHQMKTELQGLQEELAIQEEELAYQKRELEQLRLYCHRPLHNYRSVILEDIVSVSRDEASLSSPEVLRRLEYSEDRFPERFHTSVLGSRLSEISALNSTGLDPTNVKTSPRVVMEPPHSRTITPDPAPQGTQSPGSVSMSDNFSVLDSLDTDRVCDLMSLDLTAPPSPLGSTSSLSAPEWASDGYGSNVSSELGARLRVELEQTERLDAQFVEYLRCRGINPTVNTDSAAGSMSYSDDLLSPTLQGLLKKVYQESCRILTLSQRCATSSMQPHHPNKSSSNPPMSWQQEKRALQETVIALRELLCRMAQSQSQVRVFVVFFFLHSVLEVAYSNLRQELQIEQSRSVLLEKRFEDTQEELQDVRQHSAHQQEVNLQEKARLEQVDELSRRHEAEAARDRKFISDMRAQLEQERRQGEELAAMTDRLRAELLQSKRKWEEEDRTRREDLQREQEAAARQHVVLEALREQKQEASHALEVEQERSRCQAAELAELKERLRLLKDKEREREEQWEKERRKGRQEQMERERRQERTNNKLILLHKNTLQQDQQRMQELQHTLEELEREEREMVHKWLIPMLLNCYKMNNSELTERMASLSQERATLKHRLAGLERQLRRTESELAKATIETENRPINDVTSNSKVCRELMNFSTFTYSIGSDTLVQRLKALVYQKRYLLLLLGGFQECEQATLCLIAHMGARPSPPLSSQRRPLGRFRAAVRVVVAVSRMRFLTRKWQRAIRRLSLSGTVNGHPTGELSSSLVEVLRQQQPRINSESQLNRDSSVHHGDTVSALVPPTKSPFRLHSRSVIPYRTSHDPEQSLTEYIHHLEKVQQRLVGTKKGKHLEVQVR
uniref:Pericentrin/AKAP-450 centrosomal targeting domain-containing protein n=1 Tax=Mola mola TaxID=94237 RepID=A0A3Q3W5J8_MOLML